MSTRLVDTQAGQMGKYMHSDQKRDIRSYVQVVLLICTMAVGISWYSLWESYVVTRPRVSQVETGRTIPLRSHGVVVYLTHDESQKLKVLNSVGDVMAFIFISLSIWKQFLRRQAGGTDESP